MPEQTVDSLQVNAERKAGSAKADGHTIVAQSLKSLGVTHVYCVAGTPIRETFAKCAQLGIRPIGVRDQRSGVLMALAHNYVSGRLSAVGLVSAGPAVANTTTGILVAKDNCWPSVVLGGRRPLGMGGMGSFQDLDAASMFQSITKWSALVEETARIPDMLHRAFEIALRGRPGPVYLDLPEDVLTATAEAADPPSLSPPAPPQIDEAAVSRAADILMNAQRPALIVGKGVRWSKPFAELGRLVDEFGIPFITSPMGRGFLPDDHPLCANQARGILQGQADAVLLVGARLDWTFRFGTEISRDAKIIQLDIHRASIGVNRMPAVGIAGDAKSTLQAILAHMSRGRIEPRSQTVAAWHTALAAARLRRQRELETLTSSSAIPMSPHRMFKEIRDYLPRDAICVLDGNISMAAGQQVLPSYLPVTRFTAASNGCMGVGVPFAIGAKIARPDQLVVAVCGDMGFGLSAMDMETAVRHRVPVVIIVANNDGNMGAIMEKVNFPGLEERITMFEPGIHYEDIMGAFGGHAEIVERPEQMRPALERAVQSGRASCINVRIDPFAPYPTD
jgi:2-hydroxyacyl-CoA lyase 1